MNAELKSSLELFVFTFKLMIQSLLMLVLVVRFYEQFLELILKTINRRLVFVFLGLQNRLELPMILFLLFFLILLQELYFLPMNVLQLPGFIFEYARKLGIFFNKVHFFFPEVREVYLELVLY